MAMTTVQQFNYYVEKATYRKQNKWLNNLTQYLYLRRYPQALLNGIL